MDLLTEIGCYVKREKKFQYKKAADPNQLVQEDQPY